MDQSTETKPSGGEIASLLVRENVLSAAQLAYALRVKGKLAEDKPLLDVITELGYASQDQLRQFLRKHLAQLQTGPLLEELGLLTAEALQQAIRLQQQETIPQCFIVTLLDGGLIAEGRFSETLARLFGFPLVDLLFRTLDRQLCAKVPLDVCRAQLFIPLDSEGELIQVAFADPLERSSREAAVRHLGAQIKPAIATRSSILEALTSVERAPTAESPGTDETKILGLLTTIIDAGLDEKASDIHLEPMKDRLRIRFRQDGVLRLFRDLPQESAPHLAARIHALRSEQHDPRGQISVTSLKHGTSDLWASTVTTIHGEKIVLHLRDKKMDIPELNSLGLAPRMLERLACDTLDTQSGAIIVTGPAGSGITTTLYSCLNYLNTVNTSIITIEDPVEFHIDGVAQCAIDLQDGESFAQTLRDVGNQDPDVILLGRLPNLQAIQPALRTTLSGRKILTTFAAEDTLSGLNMLLSMEGEQFLVSATLRGILAQRLLSLVCTDCAKPHIPTPQEYARLGLTHEFLQGARFMAGQGCKACHFTGFRGRIAVFELLIINELVREAILTKKGTSEILRISRETSGFVSLFEDGLVKAAKGLISVRDLLRELPRLNKPRPLNELKRILGEHP